MSSDEGFPETQALADRLQFGCALRLSDRPHLAYGLRTRMKYLQRSSARMHATQLPARLGLIYEPLRHVNSAHRLLLALRLWHDGAAAEPSLLRPCDAGTCRVDGSHRRALGAAVQVHLD